MPSPDLIAPDRLEELLGGALPEAEREARLQGLVRELRADAPAAPAPLRARVRALEEQPARRRRALPRRRTALALAFVLVAIAAVGAGLALRDGRRADGRDRRCRRKRSARGAGGDHRAEAGVDETAEEQSEEPLWPTACVRPAAQDEAVERCRGRFAARRPPAAQPT